MFRYFTIYQGHVLEVLKSLPSESVQMCCTSPPYWGLRNYNVDGQLGLESTPQAYVVALVDVFEEVRRVLKPDGVLWLNLGDSYSSNPAKGGSGPNGKNGYGENYARAMRKGSGRADGIVTIDSPRNRDGSPACELAAKNLIGIPWMVAHAMQAPYYTGKINRERDRSWLAAMIDGEGTICGFDHDRADGEGHRSGLHVAITNTSTALLDEAARIWPASRSAHQTPHAGHLGTKDSWRWIVHGIENKQALLAELYPYLIAKRQQAVVGYTLLTLMANAKRLGHSPQKDAVIEKRRLLTGLLSDLNHQRAPTLPDWLIEPPSLLEPGWWLRSAITWCKKAPMPESVQDRPTSATEKIFLFTKSAKYKYNADAVRFAPLNPEDDARRILYRAEQGQKSNPTESQNGLRPRHGSTLLGGDYGRHFLGDAIPEKERRSDKQRGHSRRHAGFNDRWDLMSKAEQMAGGANLRNFWLLGPEPFPQAHFAVMPSEIPRRCILLGSDEGDTILDPFTGSGTTGMVALRYNRNFIGAELNPEYVKMARSRINDDAPLYNRELSKECLPELYAGR